nr:MAG TPA: antivirulence protein [Caudoviricetes sp.]
MFPMKTPVSSCKYYTGHLSRAIISPTEDV